jgi:hypothetical protein
VGRLYIDKDVEISPKCVEGRVFSLSSSQLQRNDPQYFFSDIYVRTLASLPTNFSIIEVLPPLPCGARTRGVYWTCVLVVIGVCSCAVCTQNKHKVVVGQLIGDGAQFQFFDTRTSAPDGVILNENKGNITVCLFKRADIVLEPRFDRFGFVAAYGAYIPHHIKLHARP